MLLLQCKLLFLLFKGNREAHILSTPEQTIMFSLKLKTDQNKRLSTQICSHGSSWERQITIFYLLLLLEVCFLFSVAAGVAASGVSCWISSSGKTVWKNFLEEPTWLQINLSIFLPLIHFNISFIWVLLFNPLTPASCCYINTQSKHISLSLLSNTIHIHFNP